MKKMKKIYFIVSLAVLALFTSCTDFNATNFPGYDDAAKPTNLVTYNYILVDVHHQPPKYGELASQYRS